MPGTLESPKIFKHVVVIGIAVDRVGEGLFANEAEPLGPDGVRRNGGGVLNGQQV